MLVIEKTHDLTNLVSNFISNNNFVKHKDIIAKYKHIHIFIKPLITKSTIKK